MLVPRFGRSSTPITKRADSIIFASDAERRSSSVPSHSTIARLQDRTVLQQNSSFRQLCRKARDLIRSARESLRACRLSSPPTTVARSAYDARSHDNRRSSLAACRSNTEVRCHVQMQRRPPSTDMAQLHGPTRQRPTRASAVFRLIVFLDHTEPSSTGISAEPPRVHRHRRSRTIVATAPSATIKSSPTFRRNNLCLQCPIRIRY